MINQHLLVSDADYFADEFKINPYYNDSDINIQKAKAEHKAIVNCFKEAGIEVTQVTPPANCQDGVYTANWALVRNGIAVMSRLPKARKAEEPYAKQTLESLGFKCVEVPDGLMFSGQGDSLIAGNYLLAGSGYRSDPAAQKFAAETLGLELVQLHANPQLNPDGTPHINPYTEHADSFWYDLDLAVAVIDEHTIAYCKEALDTESNAKIEALPLDKIIVDYDECTKGFACNMVSTGKHVIMSNKAPKFQKELESRGLICLTPDVSELKEGGGYIRCVSLWLS
ncbi:MAG: arginine deiminase-related protein [Candidatus Saccharibacteria bacterium]|nr:arginine deiminase-related protein [Candidatus Saccharibacteria bacterium]